MRKTKINRVQIRKIRTEKAMPKVKQLVRQFGRQTISYCLKQLFEYEKKVKQLENLKDEAQKLEREIK